MTIYPKKLKSLLALLIMSLTFTAVADSPSQTFDDAYHHILTGNFTEAANLINHTHDTDKRLTKLSALIAEHNGFTAQRQSILDDIFGRMLIDIEQLDLSKPPETIAEFEHAFTVIAAALEYAPARQKTEILQSQIVCDLSQTAQLKAEQFRAKGQYKNAYDVCYKWLSRIYTSDESIERTARQLQEDAYVAGYFTDTGCQTNTQRFADIDAKIFEGVLSTLDMAYVNIIDYRAMAEHALKACQRLSQITAGSNLKNSEQWRIALQELIDRTSADTDFNKDKMISVLDHVLALNLTPATTINISEEILVAHFTDAALESLDPFTKVFWPSQVQALEKALNSNYSGIGISFANRNGNMTIVNLLSDTPAYNSDLNVGDVILAVDGNLITDLSKECLTKQITGPEKTSVTLTVKNTNQDTSRDVTIERAKIKIPSINGWKKDELGNQQFMIDPASQIGCIRITSFNSETAENFENALTSLEDQGLNGLIIDLRSNRGGLLRAAAEIADKFIDHGLLVRTQPRYGMAKYVAATEQNTRKDCPVVVLVNSMTASSSEIVAGILQDPKNKRATIVGQRSYGKGTVQAITSTGLDTAKLKYTTARYHMPSGSIVKSKNESKTGYGITPDVTVNLTSGEQKQIINAQRTNTSRIEDDPQLKTAVTIIKAKIIANM